MAESKKGKPIFFEEETEKNDKPLNEHVSDFEGKLIVDELSLENDSLENTDESAANVVYHQQYDNKITEKPKNSSETICSSIDSFSVEACKEKTYSSYKIGIGEHRTAKETLCDPCSNEDIHVPATHFCKTCDDPEPLCESCAKHHIRQKICRNHQICGNIREFPNKKPNK